MHESHILPARQDCLHKAVEKIAIGMGTCILLITVFASWSPPGLRPVTTFSVGWEHIAAFGLLGTCWGYAFPRRAAQLMLLLILAAIVLEIGQFFVPGRHARLIDAATKIAGGGGGILIAHLVRRLATRAAWRRKTEL